MSLNIKSFCLGALANNGYLIWDEGTAEAFVVDPPMGSEVIAAFVRNSGLNLTKILNTHGHFDHMAGNSLLKDFFGARLYIHKNDLELLLGGASHADFFGFDIEQSPAPDGFLSEGDILPIGKFELFVMETPGHTSGGVSFLAGNSLFSGDTLFEGSIGRSDLEGGNFEQLLDSIKNKLFTLPADTIVYPGHGPQTTIGREAGFNPYLKGEKGNTNGQ